MRKADMRQLKWLSAAAMLASTPVWSHHSAAMFDMQKTVVVSGTVKEWQFMNPHSWLQVMAVDASGKEVQWSFEAAAPAGGGSSPTSLLRKDTFKPGDKITVETHPMKDGRPAGILGAVTFADGHKWIPRQPGPPADAPPGAPPMAPGAPGSGGSMPNFATPAGPDTPMAAAHRAAAKEAAGTRWGNADGFLCAKSVRPSMPNDETIKPQWIFDDVAIIGDRSTVMYVLKTSAGIMLIDSGYSTKVDSVLLPSLSQLGIEPATIKYILIAHGHPDHFGGAPYFQTHYGTRVVASSADWDVMSRPPAILPPNPLPWML